MLKEIVKKSCIRIQIRITAQIETNLLLGHVEEPTKFQEDRIKTAVARE